MDATEQAPGGGQQAAGGRHHLRTDALRALMRDRGITQTALAAQMGMDRATVNLTLMAHRPPGRIFLYALRETLPADYDDLVVWVPDADTEAAS